MNQKKIKIWLLIFLITLMTAGGLVVMGKKLNLFRGFFGMQQVPQQPLSVILQNQTCDQLDQTACERSTSCYWTQIRPNDFGCVDKMPNVVAIAANKQFTGNELIPGETAVVGSFTITNNDANATFTISGVTFSVQGTLDASKVKNLTLLRDALDFTVAPDKLVQQFKVGDIEQIDLVKKTVHFGKTGNFVEPGAMAVLSIVATIDESVETDKTLNFGLNYAGIAIDQPSLGVSGNATSPVMMVVALAHGIQNPLPQLVAAPSCKLQITPDQITVGDKSSLAMTVAGDVTSVVFNRTVVDDPAEVDVIMKKGTTTSVAPGVTTQYGASVKNNSYNATCSATLKVAPKPVLPDVPTCTITATPASISGAQTSELSMTIAGDITAVTFNEEKINDAQQIQKIKTSGIKKTVSPGAFTDYSGVVQGPAGTNSCSTHIIVTASVKSSSTISPPPNTQTPPAADQAKLIGIVSPTCEQQGKFTLNGMCIDCAPAMYLKNGSSCTIKKKQITAEAVAPPPSSQTNQAGNQTASPPAKHAAAGSAPPNLQLTQRLTHAPERGNAGPETLLYVGIMAAIQGGFWLRKKMKKPIK